MCYNKIMSDKWMLAVVICILGILITALVYADHNQSETQRTIRDKIKADIKTEQLEILAGKEFFRQKYIESTIENNRLKDQIEKLKKQLKEKTEQDNTINGYSCVWGSILLFLSIGIYALSTIGKI